MDGIADKALYYPYTHIRDVSWLKGTLLRFSEVQRMTPKPGVQPNDTIDILPFLEDGKGERPLLTRANLNLQRPVTAQLRLAERLENDAKTYKLEDRFGQKAARYARDRNDPYGFQVHPDKFLPGLLAALHKYTLAWTPETFEDYDIPKKEMIQLHPQLGEVLMATLGIACATGEGMDLVTQENAAELHRHFIKSNADDLYARLLEEKSAAFPPPQSVSAQQLFEVVIDFTCDPNRLTPELLRALGEDREPIRRLVEDLKQRVKKITARDNGPELDRALKDMTSEVLVAWKRDLNNTPNFVKRLIGIKGVDPAAKVLEKAAAIAAELGKSAHQVAGTGAMGVGAGAVLTGFANPIVMGGMGVGLAIISHVAQTAHAGREAEDKSPLLYLTKLHRSGVLVRQTLDGIQKSALTAI